MNFKIENNGTVYVFDDLTETPLVFKKDVWKVTCPTEKNIQFLKQYDCPLELQRQIGGLYHSYLLFNHLKKETFNEQN